MLSCVYDIIFCSTIIEPVYVKDVVYGLNAIEKGYISTAMATSEFLGTK